MLSRNRHCGPLLVQKALYPEAPDTCHVAILHPPGGIAGGDRLCIAAALDAGARALLTTPGATKWYRTECQPASQTVAVRARGDAVLEWLPRENILFDGSICSVHLDVELSAAATYVGWDIYCFGRRASGESWTHGRLGTRTRIRRDGRLLWAEWADIDAAGGFAASPAGLAGFSVCGTLVAAAADIGEEVQSACRDIGAGPSGARSGVTRLPGLMIARYLGDSTEDAFRYFRLLWGVLRRPLLGRDECAPRVWAC